MDEIAQVVSETVAQCRDQGKVVSETLAAFVARAVIYDHPERFQLDKELREDDVRDLIRACVDRLIEKDSPSLETVTMQVAFDEAYVSAEEELQQEQVVREAKLSELRDSIVSVRAKGGSGDFESLTRIYRQIFAYLMVRVGMESGGDRNVESEIAAALESVFPRIGLKSFILMTSDEKVAQLTELSSIVLGIRLFNREIGRGGAGLRDLTVTSFNKVATFNEQVQKDLAEVAELCQGYTDVLLYCHNRRDAGEAGGEGGDAEEADGGRIKRWQDEMTNRRQYLAYLQSLQEDGHLSHQKVSAAREAFIREMDDLKALVGSRTSVPKEAVYPKFDVLARYYLALAEELKYVEARESTLGILHSFRNSYETTLGLEWIQRARGAKRQSVAASMSAGGESKDGGGGGKTADDGKAGDGADDGKAGDEGKSSSQEGGKDGAGDDEEETPARLSIESTPEFMQLPLEYQGYCPWTLVHRDGLLLPGNPSLGVLRHKNTFNVFVSEQALQDFTANPGKYVRGVVDVARKAPELIHLLRLQDHFPQASLAYLTQGLRAATGGGGGRHPLLHPGAPDTRDAGTETPLHFVEKVRESLNDIIQVFSIFSVPRILPL